MPEASTLTTSKREAVLIEVCHLPGGVGIFIESHKDLSCLFTKGLEIFIELLKSLDQSICCLHCHKDLNGERLPPLCYLPKNCLIDCLDSLFSQKGEMPVLSNLDVILVEIYQSIHVLNCFITMARWRIISVACKPNLKVMFHCL